MALLGSVYIKKETLETMLNTVNKKQFKGVEITIAASNESNEYGQNVSAYVSQTKEDREAGKQKYYIGNGKVFWSDGTAVVAKKEYSKVSTSTTPTYPTQKEIDDLPF